MLNVAIDGPAGAGKSTVAKAVAKRLGLIYLDTGAMYRATAYYALQKGADVSDIGAVEPLLADMHMDIAFEEGAQQIYVNGVNTTPYLREHYMSKAASDISALPPVRYKMVELQREFAATRDVVLDGRDIGTFVLPNANCKFFMTATAEERANRRYKELVEKGQDVDYDTLLKDIIQRDYNDSHREVAPLKQAEDAELVDTTNMSVDEVINYIITRIEAKLNERPAKDEAKDTPEKRADEKPKKKKDDRTKKYYKPLENFGFYRFNRAILMPIQKIFFPIKVVGKENADIEGSAIFICNHYTKADTLAPCVAFFKKEAHILAKHELFTNPISGGFLYRMGAIPVRRGEADIDAAKYLLHILRAGKKVLIFPEGTRNKRGTQQMAEFKEGTARFAIKTKSPIIPMLYYSPPKACRKNWLYVGEPFTLEEFYGSKDPAAMKAATDKVRDKMEELRSIINEYVEGQK